MSKEQARPKVMEVTTLFDSDLAEYEYMQEQEAAKKAEGLADAIYTNCPACLLEEEAEKIARFVIEKQGYRKQSEVAREIFEEIEKIRSKEIHKCETLREQENEVSQRKYWEGGYNSLRQLSYWIAELKKKWEGEE